MDLSEHDILLEKRLTFVTDNVGSPIPIDLYRLRCECGWLSDFFDERRNMATTVAHHLNTSEQAEHKESWLSQR